VCIFITVLASNLFGNAVRDAFDPRLRSAFLGIGPGGQCNRDLSGKEVPSIIRTNRR